MIQEAVAKAFQTETSEESLATRLKHLKDFLKVAANGGSIDFAQSTLGTSLFVFIKVRLYSLSLIFSPEDYQIDLT